MRLLILIFFVFLVSCADSDKSKGTVISATACAKSFSDGTVVECEPTKDAMSDLDELIAGMQRIDREHPGPGTPSLDKLHSVKTIDEDVNINLENGVQLKLAGLDCTHHDLIKYLKTVFIGKSPSKLSYIETGYAKGEVLYAYVWEVDTDFGEDLDDGDIKFGPMVGNMNETALTSSWCKPKKQDGHLYYERFLQLSKLAK